MISEKWKALYRDCAGGANVVTLTLSLLIVFSLFALVFEITHIYTVHSAVQDQFQKIVNAGVQNASYLDYRIDYQGAGKTSVDPEHRARRSALSGTAAWVYDSTEISDFVYQQFLHTTASAGSSYVPGTNSITYTTELDRGSSSIWKLSRLTYTFEPETGYCCAKGVLTIYPTVKIFGNEFAGIDTQLKVIVRDTRVDYNPNTQHNNGTTGYINHGSAWFQETYGESIRDYNRHFEDASSDPTSLSYLWKRAFGG